MNPAVALSPTGNQPASIDFEKALASHFGRSFTVERLGQLGEATDHLATLVEELNDSTSAKSCIHNPDGTYTFALAWSQEAQYWIAVADCDAEEEALLCLLADSWGRERAREREEEELSQLSRQLTIQVSRGFEELTLSRLLATALSSCDASQNMSHLAEMILPDLRRTIRAGTVALVSNQDKSAQVEVVERVDASQPANDEILDCLRCFCSASQFQPFVCTQSVVAAEISVTNVYGLAIVKVQKGEEIAGWLVAFNPTGRAHASSGICHSG